MILYTVRSLIRPGLRGNDDPEERKEGTTNRKGEEDREERGKGEESWYPHFLCESYTL